MQANIVLWRAATGKIPAPGNAEVQSYSAPHVDGAPLQVCSLFWLL